MSYGLVEVKCPFCIASGKDYISCGEYMEGCTMRLSFKRYSEKEFYSKHLCNSYDYKKCDVAKMLMGISED